MKGKQIIGAIVCATLGMVAVVKSVSAEESKNARVTCRYSDLEQDTSEWSVLEQTRVGGSARKWESQCRAQRKQRVELARAGQTPVAREVQKFATFVRGIDRSLNPQVEKMVFPETVLIAGFESDQTSSVGAAIADSGLFEQGKVERNPALSQDAWARRIAAEKACGGKSSFEVDRCRSNFFEAYDALYPESDSFSQGRTAGEEMSIIEELK